MQAQSPYPQQHQLIDMALNRLALKNDAALARTTKIAPPVISRLRRGYGRVTAGVILALVDVGIPLVDVRANIAGADDTRATCDTITAPLF